MDKMEEEDLNTEELCSRVFIKKKPFLARLNCEILSWCRCETSNTKKGRFISGYLCRSSQVDNKTSLALEQ